MRANISRKWLTWYFFTSYFLLCLSIRLYTDLEQLLEWWDKWHMSIYVDKTKLSDSLLQYISMLCNQWHIQGGGVIVRLPHSLVWTRIFDHFCSIFVSFVLRLNHKIRVQRFLSVKNSIKSFFLGGAQPPPPHPTPFPIFTEILNMPLYVTIYNIWLLWQWHSQVKCNIFVHHTISATLPPT